MNRRVVLTGSAVLSNAVNERQRAEDSFPKQCLCGAVYQESDWMSLPYHGVFSGTDESTGRRFGSNLEIRVCVCGSSLAVQLKGGD